jgi:hypothetical protein
MNFTKGSLNGTLGLKLIGSENDFMIFGNNVQIQFYSKNCEFLFHVNLGDLNESPQFYFKDFLFF